LLVEMGVKKIMPLLMVELLALIAVNRRLWD
jgi:hypothetical protein